MTTGSPWNKKNVSRTSPDAELNRQPKSPRKLREEEAIGPRVSKAIASNVIIIIIIIITKKKNGWWKERPLSLIFWVKLTPLERNRRFSVYISS